MMSDGTLILCKRMQRTRNIKYVSKNKVHFYLLKEIFLKGNELYKSKDNNNVSWGL